MALERPANLAEQVADILRTSILRGDFDPDTPLPSESQLAAAHGVSRITVRGAMAALRGEGLVTVVHGKGSFVRAPTPRQQIRRTAPDLSPSALRAADAGTPILSFSIATTHVAAVLGIKQGTPTVVREILHAPNDVAPNTAAVADNTAAAPYILTSHLPAALTEGTALANAQTSIADVDGILTELGHTLTFTDYVTARMPVPAERDALRIADGIPLLRATRVTLDADTHTPLEARVTLLPAEGVELEYRLPQPEPS